MLRILAPTAAGRRLFMEYNGADDSLHTNVLRQTLDLAFAFLGVADVS
jgi:hypothetical protein